MSLSLSLSLSLPLSLSLSLRLPYSHLEDIGAVRIRLLQTDDKLSAHPGQTRQGPHPGAPQQRPPHRLPTGLGFRRRA